MRRLLFALLVLGALADHSEAQVITGNIAGPCATANSLALFTASTTLGCASVTDNGAGTLTGPAAGNLAFYAATGRNLLLGGNAGTQFTLDGTNAIFASGQVWLPDGTAALPSLSFFNNPNTGWYRYGAGATAWSASGVAVFAFNAAGATGQYGSSWQLGWTPVTDPTAVNADAGFKRSGPGTVQVTDGATGFGTLRVGTGTALQVGGANAQSANVKQISELHTLALAGTSDTTMQVPAGALVLGVSARVTTAITSGVGTSWSIGDSTLATRYGSTLAFALNTTSMSAPTTYFVPAAATSIRVTCNGGTFTAGVIRITAYYIDLTAPTS